METTERIVESYVRYVRKWATIPNIKCPDQHVIDLIAIDPPTAKKYHIESGVSVSQGYSKLTAKPFSPDMLIQRVGKAGQRRTLGYFTEVKFGAEGVRKTLKEYGFKPGNYQKIIVTWGCEEGVLREAVKRKIVIWNFPDLMQEIAKQFEGMRTYFIDDTLRTLHLFQKALSESGGARELG